MLTMHSWKIIITPFPLPAAFKSMQNQDYDDSDGAKLDGSGSLVYRKKNSGSWEGLLHWRWEAVSNG
jgi:hypothetical protein